MRLVSWPRTRFKPQGRCPLALWRAHASRGADLHPSRAHQPNRRARHFGHPSLPGGPPCRRARFSCVATSSDAAGARRNAGHGRGCERQRGPRVVGRGRWVCLSVPAEHVCASVLAATAPRYVTSGRGTRDGDGDGIEVENLGEVALGNRLCREGVEVVEWGRAWRRRCCVRARTCVRACARARARVCARGLLRG